VISKLPGPGTIVAPVLGPILELADLSSLVVEVDVPEIQLAKVGVGRPCEISLDAFPNRRFRGAVKELGPVVDAAKATLKVRVGFVDDLEGVLPNMAARASFLSKPLERQELATPAKLVVPGAALTKRNGQNVVFVVDGERVRLTPVQIGPAAGSGFELLEGPSDGASVVKSPPDGLADGQRIRKRKDQ
jgi:multidrug efflux pump subunit AcrA (membrane-fusion protein)